MKTCVIIYAFKLEVLILFSPRIDTLAHAEVRLEEALAYKESGLGKELCYIINFNEAYFYPLRLSLNNEHYC